MNVLKLEQYTQATIDIYRWYTQAIIAAYQKVYMTSHPTYALARKVMEREFKALGRSLTHSLTTTLTLMIKQIVDDAITNATQKEIALGKRNEIESAAHEALNVVLNTLNVASAVDANTLRKSMADLSMRVSTIMNTGTVSYPIALARARADMPMNVAFVQLDRSGKRWDSMRYVHATLRGFLLKLYTDSFVRALSVDGTDEAKVIHPDEKHENNGLVFSISGQSVSLPSYYSIRETVFHPNSRAMVERNVA